MSRTDTALSTASSTRSRWAWAITRSPAVEGGHGERRDALAAADEAHPLAGESLDVDVLGPHAEPVGQGGADRVAVRRELGALHDDGGVDVGHGQPALGERGDHG